MVTLVVSVIIVYGMAFSMSHFRKSELRMTNRADARDTQQTLEKLMQKATMVVRAEHFDNARTFVYSPDADPRLNPYGITGTTGITINESLQVDFTQIAAEPVSFLDPQFTVSATVVPFRLDSFTLSILRVTNSMGTLGGEVGRIFLSRCVPLNGLSADRSAIDPRAPQKSLQRLLAPAIRFPFLRWDNGRYTYSCCPLNNRTCTDGAPNWLPRIFVFQMEDQRAVQVSEWPSGFNTNSLGNAFFVAMDNGLTPTTYRVLFMDLEDECRTSLVGHPSCRSQGTPVAGAGLVDQLVAVKPYQRFGKVKRGFESAGVIILGEQ